MTEQSIRDDMSEELFKMYDHGTQPNSYVEADYLLASPVIRRIQAAAIREAVRIFAEGGWVDTFIEESVQDDVSAVVATDKWFNDYADRIEDGDTGCSQ